MSRESKIPYNLIRERERRGKNVMEESVGKGGRGGKDDMESSNNMFERKRLFKLKPTSYSINNLKPLF